MAKVAAMLGSQTAGAFNPDLPMTSVVDPMSVTSTSDPSTSIMAPNVPDPVGVNAAVDGQVLLRDVRHLVRQGNVAPPSGFTKMGLPILYFPEESGAVVVGRGSSFASVQESDLHLLFKYYLAVVPRTEQASGFALIIDRRLDDWASVRTVFKKVVSLFPARIREVYLLHHRRHHAHHHQPQLHNKDLIVNQLIHDFLLDFDIYVIEDQTELLHHIGAKHLPVSLGGEATNELENWLMVQELVEAFSFNARRIARKLAHFVGVLNREDLNYHADSLREIAAKNRTIYRRLRKELEDLTNHGHYLMTSLQNPDANLMQRLAVQILCKQLDQAWTYFSRSWKMQDHVYVQYLELNAFQQRFRELANTIAANERMVQELPSAGNTTEELNAALDKIDSFAQSLAVDGAKARELSKIGQELLQDHNFALDCVQPKCSELKMMCQKLELLLTEKRRMLHKFLDLFDGVQQINKWCDTSMDHLSRTSEDNREDVFSQIRQIDYLLSRSRELKLRTRMDFETVYEDIKDLMSAQTLFAVDDALEQLEAVTIRVIQRRDELRTLSTRADKKFSVSMSSGSNEADPNSEALKIRREKILSELIMTECRYVDDLEQVLRNYKDKLAVSNLTETRTRANTIFGNLHEIHEFHAVLLYPELERCGANPASVARVMLANLNDLRSLYTSYCQNMPASRQAIADMGGETSPSILHHCQQEAGHALPLSSYLLKPMQRLTKYQLLLKDLAESSNVVCGKAELEDAISELIGVVRVVNDSMHSVTIKGLPKAASPLGALVAHDIFQVFCVENNNKASQINLFRSRGQRRHVFIYDNYVLFVKAISEKAHQYQFKLCLATASLGVSGALKTDDKKLELWVNGRNEIYTLEAKSKQAKENFATELRKVVQRQKEIQRSADQRTNGVQQQVFYDTASTTCSSESEAARTSRLSRSRSLESSRAHLPLRSRSLDCNGERQSPDEDLDDEDEEIGEDVGDLSGGRQRRRRMARHRTGNRYLVLADYMALTSREIDLTEDETVELIKVGCSGWWYVRITTYPYAEGWAPSTYLEKVRDISNQ